MRGREEGILRHRRHHMIVAGEAGAGTETGMEKNVPAMVQGEAIGQHPGGRHLIAIVVIHQGGTRKERTIEGMDEGEGVEVVHIPRILLHLQISES